MNYKLEYITKVFANTSKKKIENYVITRIWHLLNNDEIRIMPQQYVNRDGAKYALTDLYFPQINLHLEVNEEFHYKDGHKISLDKQREDDIVRKTKGHIIRFIDCQKDLKDIHTQIDTIVLEINKLIVDQKSSNSFRPWLEGELTPEYWIEKGILNVKDNVNLRTIDHIGRLFSLKIVNRGYLKAGAAKYTKDGFSEVWWPSEIKRSNWQNNFINDFEKITEKNLIETKGNNHVQSYVTQNPDCKRIVFFKYKDELGFDYYKFVGCYRLNAEASLRDGELVWERFSETYSLSIKKAVS